MPDAPPDAPLGADALARAARAGDAAAFDALARRVSPGLMGFLRRRCPTEQDAEDLRQETLLRAFVNLARYDPARPVGPWLRTLAARLAADRRRGRPRPAQLAADVPSRARGGADESADREAGAALWSAAADALPPAQYRALRLRYADGLDVAAVAAAMPVSVANAKVLLFRARRRLMALPSVRGLLDSPPLSSTKEAADAE